MNVPSLNIPQIKPTNFGLKVFAHANNGEIALCQVSAADLGVLNAKKSRLSPDVQEMIEGANRKFTYDDRFDDSDKEYWVALNTKTHTIEGMLKRGNYNYPSGATDDGIFGLSGTLNVIKLMLSARRDPEYLKPSIFPSTVPVMVPDSLVSQITGQNVEIQQRETRSILGPDWQKAEFSELPAVDYVDKQRFFNDMQPQNLKLSNDVKFSSGMLA